ncbi:MAG: transketolase [Gammaproteobacteria bacterium]
MPSRKDLANAIRALSMDAVQQANSGHPGAPLGMADVAQVLWSDHLKHNPANPQWPNRDRFVLSNGHGSMLIYSLLHLSGYDLPLEELINFRQLHSRTAGHPEYGITPGVETTTGPLGQGITNAVGMALAEKMLAATYNRPGHDIVDNYTYVFLGDGCLMEGISHEACSLAGTLQLGKLICVYDDNNISIDGEVGGWFTDDTPARFRAYGWNVIENVNGHDADACNKAITEARSSDDNKPTLICCKTEIGYGSPNKAGKSSSHGAPLGEDEIKLTREKLGWAHEPFHVPDDLRAAWNATEQGAAAEAAWRKALDAYRADHPELAAELERRWAGDLPEGWTAHADSVIERLSEEAKSMATRKASAQALEGFGPALPELIGGSADLTGSVNTFWSESKGVTPDDATGNYIWYGVREFGMSAMMNGMWLYGGFKPYSGTFLTFSDYARNAVRMAALMEVPSTFVYTHDSIGLGEDGPTHQPVEHLASLRLMPNLDVWRPCDTVEAAVAWRAAIESEKRPHCLVFSRQGVPFQSRSDAQVADVAKGGYVLRDTSGAPDVIFIGTGTELSLAVEAAERLSEQGVSARVVSMPCTSVFDRQDQNYRDSVLPPNVSARVVVEAGVTDGWWRYAGTQGRVVGIDRFGESAPAPEVYAYLGVTVERLVDEAQQLLA